MKTCSKPGCTTTLNKRSLDHGDGLCSHHRRYYTSAAPVICSKEGCTTILKGSSLKRKDGLCSKHKPHSDKVTTQQRERNCKNDGEGALVKHKVPCRNGCKLTIAVMTQAGEQPSKFQYCAGCKLKASGLGHGTYPDHGTNADALNIK